MLPRELPYALHLENFFVLQQQQCAATAATQRGVGAASLVVAADMQHASNGKRRDGETSRARAAVRRAVSGTAVGVGSVVGGVHVDDAAYIIDAVDHAVVASVGAVQPF